MKLLGRDIAGLIYSKVRALRSCVPKDDRSAII
jgi:hypothetical protein